MTLSRQLGRLACLWLSAALGVACSDDEASSAVVGPDLPKFNDISTAPAKIQNSAKAVFRIRTAGGSGTGSFISPTGLLLTNNHILGDVACAREGCYLEITLMHQRGQSKRDPIIAFAVPQTFNPGLDMAVAQLYTQAGGDPFGSPDYLQFNPQDSSALLGKHVTIVGHPEGYLKKWTDGTVVDATGKWFTTTNYTLPGNSGSPVLDDDGNIVGLLHRGPTSQDLFTDNGVNMYSVGTASGPISAALGDPLPSTMLSASASTTADAFVANNLVYLNARFDMVNIGGVPTSPLSLLGDACDAGLARTDIMTPDDLDTALSPCYDSHIWIECRYDAGPSAYGTLCPAASDIAAWVNRDKLQSQRWQAMNGMFQYYALSFCVAALQPSKILGMAAGAQSLQDNVVGANPNLDFSLAYYLAAFGIGTYGDTSIHDYIVNYAQVSHYEMQAKIIAYAASWLWGQGAMSKSDMLAFVRKLLDDPKVSVGAQLAMEDFLYGLGAL
jgi:hypothetical protein